MPMARVLLFLCLCGVPLVGLSETESREPATYASEVLTLEQARPLTLVGSSQLRVAFFKVFNSKLFTKTGSGMTPVTRSGLSLRINVISPAVFWQSRQRRSGIIWSLMTLDDRSGRQRSWLCGQMSKRATRLRLMSTSKASAFFYNGTWVGSVEDPDFAPAFIAIWLSPKTSRPAHREGLLAE